MGYADANIKSNSKFLKIEAGTPTDVRLLNESPVEIYKHSMPVGAPLDCSGSDTCLKCQSGELPVQKFVTNVYDYSTESVLLWEYGSGVARQLQAIATTLEEEDREITKADLKVEAKGANKDKRYTITPRGSAKVLPTGLKLHPINGIPF